MDVQFQRWKILYFLNALTVCVKCTNGKNKMSYLDRYCDISVLKDKVLESIEQIDEQIIFTTVDGETYKMYHEQDCCESVYIESIVGDLEDLLLEPIIRAETAENLFDLIKQADADVSGDESYTWTFYKLATRKGYVDIRWYGSSNGYYSEGVSFIRKT